MKSQNNDSETGFTLIEVIITIVVIAVVAAMMTAYFGTGIIQSSLPIFRLTASGKLNAVMEKISAQYGQYPIWQPNTTYAAGAIILPTPSKRTGLLYTTTSGGTSGADLTLEPDWKTRITMGSTFFSTDGNITWKTVWDSGHNSVTDNGAAPTLVLHNGRIASHQYITADPVTIVYPGNGYQYIRTTSGTTGAGEPAWSSATASGSTVTPSDGTVTWQCIGYAPTYTLDAVPYTGGLKDAINRGCSAANCDNAFGRYRIIENKFIRFDTSVSPATEQDIDSDLNNVDYGKYLKVTIGLHSGDADAAQTSTLTTLFVSR